MAALFKKKSDDSDKKEKSTKKKSEKKESKIQGQVGRVLPATVLRKPLITEKTHALSESGKYIFLVEKRSSKDAVKKAVEQLYDVKVASVRTQVRKPKKRRFGRVVGYTVGKKMATVTLKQGDSIDVFKQV